MRCYVCQRSVRDLVEIPTDIPGEICVEARCHGERRQYRFGISFLREMEAKGQKPDNFVAFGPTRRKEDPRPKTEPAKGNPVDTLLDLYRPGWRNGPGDTPSRRLQAVKGALAAQRVMLQCASAVQMQNGVLRSVLDQLKAAGLENEYARKVADQLHAEFATVPNGEITE
ncbi:hypothetical protein RG2014_041 [Delftia phage RG-2014]|uniref:Uncharacterized protein n=1 Tax=Delftia phage RG-2014 TaxID=1563661 RepID=A0A097PAN3_9CAUD|nr:hypothetical protein RG2014_041 [Delftia phage RG-2014]AIU44295.1 hypothetical protein RG2014_041 [Delftia phage RG-2014]